MFPGVYCAKPVWYRLHGYLVALNTNIHHLGDCAEYNPRTLVTVLILELVVKALLRRNWIPFCLDMGFAPTGIARTRSNINTCDIAIIRIVYDTHVSSHSNTGLYISLRTRINSF